MSSDSPELPGTPSAAATESAPAPAPEKTASGLWRSPLMWIACIALGLLAWQWLETRVRFGEVREEVLHRLTENDASIKAARAQAAQAQESAQAAQARMALLEARLTEAQGQQAALDTLYRELARGHDERVLAEVEQAVTIAAQQLQYAGNVQAALFALQGADALLARSASPRHAALRRLLARDAARLKALPGADVPGMTQRLEEILVTVDALPLAFEHRPKEEPPPAASSPARLDFWRGLVREMWSEMRQLVRIERLDQPAPGLLPPAQNFFLKENLRLRLLNARLALMAGDSRAFHDDMRAVETWLARYFDTRDKSVSAALHTAKSLAATELLTNAPGLAETLNTLRNYRVAGEK